MKCKKATISKKPNRSRPAFLFLRIFILSVLNDTGLNPADKTLEGMVKETPGQLNFTAFLSLFSEKLSGEYWGVFLSLEWFSGREKVVPGVVVKTSRPILRRCRHWKDPPIYFLLLFVSIDY